MKYLKLQYQNYGDLERNSSGFGWDSKAKKFTATDEVWQDYIKGHPNHKYMRYDSHDQFEDLKTIFGCATANGNFSIGLGDTTNARTEKDDDFQVQENLIDENNDDVCVLSPQQQPPEYAASPFSERNPKGRLEKLNTRRKRSRTDALSNSCELDNDHNDSMITMSNKILSVIQQREERQEKEAKQREEKLRLESEQKEAEKKKNNVWDAMKEVPNLDQHAKFKAVTLIYSLGMKDMFTDMSVEERYGWIQSNISS